MFKLVRSFEGCNESDGLVWFGFEGLSWSWRPYARSLCQQVAVFADGTDAGLLPLGARERECLPPAQAGAHSDQQQRSRQDQARNRRELDRTGAHNVHRNERDTKKRRRNGRRRPRAGGLRDVGRTKLTIDQLVMRVPSRSGSALDANSPATKRKKVNKRSSH